MASHRVITSSGLAFETAHQRGGYNGAVLNRKQANVYLHLDLNLPPLGGDLYVWLWHMTSGSCDDVSHARARAAYARRLKFRFRLTWWQPKEGGRKVPHFPPSGPLRNATGSATLEENKL